MIELAIFKVGIYLVCNFSNCTQNGKLLKYLVFISEYSLVATVVSKDVAKSKHAQLQNVVLLNP